MAVFRPRAAPAAFPIICMSSSLEGQTMNDKPNPSAETREGRDYSKTLFLPKTDFPMRAVRPQREPEVLKRWDAMGLYKRLRAAAKGREKYILHDGPPYANGHIHI